MGQDTPESHTLRHLPVCGISQIHTHRISSGERDISVPSVELSLKGCQKLWEEQMLLWLKYK